MTKIEDTVDEKKIERNILIAEQNTNLKRRDSLRK